MEDVQFEYLTGLRGEIADGGGIQSIRTDHQSPCEVTAAQPVLFFCVCCPRIPALELIFAHQSSLVFLQKTNF